MPTVADRVAQTVVKLTLEPELEQHFHSDSYGYRPGKSAHDAIRVTRKRCWQSDWVLELDIKGMFDNLSHSLIMKALSHHTSEKWILLYCERWLGAEMINPDGTTLARTLGTPQGGVISPLLMNLFMHFGFDVWMEREFKGIKWARYADDIVVHAKTENEVKVLKMRLGSRLREVGLEMHPEKTRIVYCGSSPNRKKHEHTKFTFLGYEFRFRQALNRQGKSFTSFSPAVGKKQLKEMRRRIKREFCLKNKLHWSLEQIAAFVNPILRGWIQYYGAFRKSELFKLTVYMNQVLVQWLCRKHQIPRNKKNICYLRFKKVVKRQPSLFVHWNLVRS